VPHAGNIPHFGEFSFASSQKAVETDSQEFTASQDSIIQSEQDPTVDGASQNLSGFNFRDGCTIIETVAKKDTVEVFDPQGQFSQNGNHFYLVSVLSNWIRRKMVRGADGPVQNRRNFSSL
jgi:hypothetical protein